MREQTLIPLNDYLEACALAVEDAARTSVAGVLAAGKALDAARKRFPSNQEFGAWREKRMPWLSKEMAWHWVNVYQKFGDADPSLKFLTTGVSTLYALAAPSTPDEVVDAAVTLVQSGEKVDGDMVKRLKSEIESLKRDKTETIQRLIAEKDKEQRKRKQAEAVTKATDREAELAKQKAEAEKRAERLESELASAKAQLDGGLGIDELLEPKVIIKEDTESKRELDRVRKELEEKTRLHLLAVEHSNRFQEEMMKANQRNIDLEKRITAMDDAAAVLAIFAKQVPEWRSQTDFALAVLEKHEHSIDSATLSNVRKLYDRLQSVIETSKDRASLASG